MALRIQSNIQSLSTHRAMKMNDAALSKSLERLSTGFRINRASDDAAGLAVSMRFRSQIRAFQQGASNASQATSLLQVAEGAADQITNILSRMKELATQAASANISTSDRTKINSEVSSLESEIDRIANSTKYGGTTLLDGSFGTVGVSSGAGSNGNLDNGNNVETLDVSGATALTSYSVAVSSAAGIKSMTIDSAGVTQTIALTIGSIASGDTQVLDFNSLGIKVTVQDDYDDDLTAFTGTVETAAVGDSDFQIGFENTQNDRLSFSLSQLDSGSNGLNVDVTLDTLSGAQTALTTIDTAINALATARADIGGVQNRFGFASANLATSIENLTAANAVIRDADMAFETVAFTKNQILMQAGTSMLAQANIQPQNLLSLLQ